MMRFCKVGVVILDRDSLLSISFGISNKFNMSESELVFSHFLNGTSSPPHFNYFLLDYSCT